ncbi:hypothetical protein [Halomonas heilongjiangensis]|uniref:Uncharacterized protein n=1 Tax=Halomonas heilongjiangensis TaxID=1387883 RepID=A0A2N7TQ89_9GAMM|nr:hypothetical protein [Halomonas heilongjiangensis]PMR70345.1 hypothetical protein C1H66_07330 [Halomonas heilongjiangensis]PXX87364.1 hypothetical protein CR158_20320 [Halomonas heilongjiangensis]
MIKKLFAALALMLFTASAWANMCPALMGEIDEALEDEATVAMLDEGQLEEVRDLRARGEEAHGAGDHDESVALLEQAKEILGI